MTQYEVIEVSVETGKKNSTVILECMDMDAIFLTDNIDLEIELPKARFEFTGKSALRYLMKVAAGQRQTRAKKTLAEKFKALEGCYISLPDSFKVAA